MKKDINFKVVGAFLHQSVVWPGEKIGSEKSLSREKMGQYVITLIPQGMLIEGKRDGILIPHANVANYIVEISKE